MLWAIHAIDTTKRMIAKYPDVFEYVTTTEGFKQAMQQGRIASMLGMEGGQYIYNSASALRTFYDLGVRYMTVSIRERKGGKCHPILTFLCGVLGI